MENQDMLWLLREKYGGKKSEAFYADCKRLALGEPLAYLIGWTPFLDCKIWLDSRPLIPRPETEFWTEQAIAAMRAAPKKDDLRVLDLCAGSGCIGVTVAKAFPRATVDFAEIDTNHLPTIEKNLKENDIDTERCKLLHSNLFTVIDGSYDFILTNPPYVDAALNRVSASVTEHEPYVALFGGENGLEVIIDIITDARQHLSPHGQLWIEHDPEQSQTIQKVGATEGFRVSTHPDQFKNERYSTLVLQ